MARGIVALTAEGPTMSADTDAATGAVTIGAMSELHLEAISSTDLTWTARPARDSLDQHQCSRPDARLTRHHHVLAT